MFYQYLINMSLKRPNLELYYGIGSRPFIIVNRERNPSSWLPSTICFLNCTKEEAICWLQLFKEAEEIKDPDIDNIIFLHDTSGYTTAFIIKYGVKVDFEEESKEDINILDAFNE